MTVPATVILTLITFSADFFLSPGKSPSLVLCVIAICLPAGLFSICPRKAVLCTLNMLHTHRYIHV